MAYSNFRQGVYGYFNIKNKKWYIGKTKNDKKRKSQYSNMSFQNQVKFYNAVLKYGWQNFQYYWLQDVINPYELDECQKRWIKIYDSFNNGYNCDEGGGGRLGYSHSEETKIKISKANKGKSINKGIKKTQQQKRQHSKCMTGRPSGAKGTKRTQQQRKIMSQSQKGKIPWNKGQTNIYSKQTLEKMSKSKIGTQPWNKGKTCIFSQETIQNMSKLHKGKHISTKTQFKKGHISSKKGKFDIIPQFSLDENKILTKVIPKRFQKCKQISDWHVMCNKLSCQNYNKKMSSDK